tara:strand:+ start:1138 stop:1290 length:153 start_codon:yes stop_codon:yes gene_type:complete
MKTFIKDVIACSLIGLGFCYKEPTGSAIMILFGAILLAVNVVENTNNIKD